MGSFSIWHWLIVLAIVVLVFGTKKSSMKEGEAEAERHSAELIQQRADQHQSSTQSEKDKV